MASPSAVSTSVSPSAVSGTTLSSKASSPTSPPSPKPPSPSPSSPTLPPPTLTSRLSNDNVYYTSSADAPPSTINEKHLVAKLDRNIIPLVMALYLFSFLDRVNIGNARLYGLEEDLGLVGVQFQVAVSILFVTYIFFEIPSNLILKKFRPGRYIAIITVLWGVVATLTGIVNNYGELVAVRLLLGALEAGLFPGLTVYLTFFYTKKELALRIGYLFVSAALAGACGGLLAYGIGHMDGIAGLRGWRWILILEGIPTVIVGVITLFVLADDIDNASYLTPEEKEYMKERMLREMGQTKKGMEFHWSDVRKCFLDWHCWGFAIAQFGVDTMLYGFSTFLPSIIKGFGGTGTRTAWSTPVVQALTIPCYAVGAVSYLVTAYFSDKYQSRAIPTVLGSLLSIIGYGLLLSPVPTGVQYFSCILIAMGLYIAVGLPLSWLPSNCPRYGKRTAASGLQLTVGNFAGVMAPFIYPGKDAPKYFVGHLVTLLMVTMGAMVYTVLWGSYKRINGRRARGEEDESVMGMSEEEVMELGDKAPTFVYTT